MKKRSTIIGIILCICTLIIPMVSEAADPSIEHPHIATCGADSLIIKSNHSLWFFGTTEEGDCLTPIKIMDNVKKVTIGNMSTTYGAYMPTYLILTYDGSLYIGGTCRYSPFALSENVSLLNPEKIWDDVRDIDTPSGYGNYRFVNNSGDMYEYSMGSLQDVINIGDKTIDEYYKSERSEIYNRQIDWLKQYWWNIDDLAEEDMSAGFYLFVKNDGSVWTGINCPADYKWYHGFVIGDGSESIQSNVDVYREPVQIMPSGTCWPDISVILDGEELNFDVRPTIINDRTMVPVRAIFEALGASINWDDSTKTVISTKNSTTVKMTLSDSNMYVNNQVIKLDAPVSIINDRILVPIRAVSEAYGEDVDWDSETSTVIISTVK